MMRRLRDTEGFTLLEVMITVVILAVGLIGLAGLQIVSIKSNSFGQQMSVASTLAQNQLEQLRQTVYSSLADGSDFYDDTVNGVRYTRAWDVMPDASHPDWMRVEVTVSWTGPTDNRSITLSTVISNS